MKFEELKINKNTVKAIEEMGFKDLMPIQKESIPYILKGKDLVGQAQTGTGKTAAFGIPMFENIERGYINHLILAPTRELAIQIVSELKKIGKYHENINIATIVGGMDMKKQLNEIKNKPVIVVATPGRLNDFLKRKKINLSKLKMFVIDEVDELFKSGFKEEIDGHQHALTASGHECESARHVRRRVFMGTADHRRQLFAEHFLVRHLLDDRCVIGAEIAE